MWTFDSDTDPGYWVEVESPTNATLRDLTGTANGPVAVGDKGVAVGRGNDRWGVILENGPGARSQTLHAVDSTDDGERLWFAGAGGALGYYDLQTKQRRDYSKPQGNAGTFYSLTVSGDRGEEKLLVADGSGHVIPAHVRDDSATDVTIGWETTPNAGNAVEAIAHDDEGYGYAVDVNSNVFMTTEKDGWTRVGVDDAQGSFYDCAYGDGVFVTGGGNGKVFEAAELTDHNEEATWTPTELGEFTVYGLDAGYGGQLACGEGGNVYIRQTGGEWERGKHEPTHTFRAGLVDEQMVVVGAAGLIVERRGPEKASEETKARHGDGSAGGDDPADGSDGSTDGGGDSDDTTDGGSGDANDDATDERDGSTGESGQQSSEYARNEDGGTANDGTVGDPNDGTERGVVSDGRTGSVETDIDWRLGPGSGGGTEPADGDAFDGRGENYDGDAAAPGESGNDEADPADEPDGGNDESDPADEPDGGSGNDEADVNTDSDADGDSGNDESDEADVNTDSDADSPD